MSAAHWLALIMLVAAFLAGVGAVMARALFASIAALAATAALTAAALAFLGAAPAALMAAIAFAALGPVLLLGAVLLSARSTKAHPRPAGWLIAGGAGTIAGLIILGAAEFDGHVAPIYGAHPMSLAWIGLIVFVSVAACVAMLGFGEAGAFEERE